jgi:exoribonuclease-2
LGLDEYARTTSPLRRYLDLVVHQKLRAYVLDQELLDDQQIMERVGAAEAISASVRQTERLCRQHWTLVYLMQHPNWSGEAILIDRRGRRGLVVIPSLALEQSIHLDTEVELNSSIPLHLEGVNLPHLSAHFRIGT